MLDSRMFIYDLVISKSHHPNQSDLQGLLDRKSCFKYACNVANYPIPDQDVPRCMSSFFSYARELTNIRENIKTLDQKNMFDLEVSLYFENRNH